MRGLVERALVVFRPLQGGGLCFGGSVSDLPRLIPFEEGVGPFRVRGLGVELRPLEVALRLRRVGLQGLLLPGGLLDQVGLAPGVRLQRTGAGLQDLMVLPGGRQLSLRYVQRVF